MKNIERYRNEDEKKRNSGKPTHINCENEQALQFSRCSVWTFSCPYDNFGRFPFGFFKNNRGASFLVILQLVTERSCINIKAKKIKVELSIEPVSVSVWCLSWGKFHFVLSSFFCIQLSTSSCWCYFCWFGLFSISSWIIIVYFFLRWEPHACCHS